MAITRRKPGAYVERTKSAPSIKLDASTSVAGFVGETLRGEPNVAIKVTGWSQFIENFAKGYSNPYTIGHIADSVESFFLNGGSELYVVRVLGSDSAKATATIPQSGGLVFKALEDGAWGNDLSIDITSSQSKFNLKISLLGNVVEEIKDLDSKDWERINALSEYVRVTEGTIQVGTGTLKNGSNGTLNANNYIKGLDSFNAIRDINTLAIPGVSIEGVQEGLVDYCTNRDRVFPIIDSPKGATEEEVIAFYGRLSGYRGALYYPWVTKKDSVTGNLKVVPPSGAIAGLYARTDSTRGVHKAPAGVEANLKGIVGVENLLEDSTIGTLNSKNINCIIPLTGYGIVVWGARLIGQDGEDRRFVSDLRLDDYIENSIEQGTLWATFEPIDDQLFSDLEAQISAFFNTLMQKGSIKGETAEEAYYVICDETINPDPNASTVDIEVGYAKNKPAEFVVTRISQMREV